MASVLRSGRSSASVDSFRQHTIEVAPFFARSPSSALTAENTGTRRATRHRLYPYEHGKIDGFDPARSDAAASGADSPLSGSSR